MVDGCSQVFGYGGVDIYRVGGLTMAMLLGLGLALVKDKPTGKIKKQKRR